MSQHAIASPSTLVDSAMVKQKREKFALLARVGHQKREVCRLHEEADFYSSIVTELLALSTESLTLLVAEEEKHPELKLPILTLVSRQTNLLKRLLNYWPRDSQSQERVCALLESDGLETMTDVSDEGYVSPSMDLILRNVARAIEVTKMGLSPKQSSNSKVTMQ
jgi:hypothetical protein